MNRTYEILDYPDGGYFLRLLEDGLISASAVLHQSNLNPGSALANTTALAEAWIAPASPPQPRETPPGTVPAERDRCIRICLEQAESARRVMAKVADTGSKSALLYGAVVAESCAAVIASGSGA